MYLSPFLTSFFALMAAAAPLVNFTESESLDYRIQTMHITTPNGNPESDGLVRVAFTLWDTNADSANVTTTCQTSWKAGTDEWPHSSIACNDDSFRWSFSKLTSITDWNMEASHGFPAFGMYVRTFNNGTTTRDDFDCVTSASGAEHCRLKQDHTITLHYYAMIG